MMNTLNFLLGKLDRQEAGLSCFKVIFVQVCLFVNVELQFGQSSKEIK